MTFLTHGRAAELRAIYRLWDIWESDFGRWWAMRPGLVTPAQRNNGAVATVDADDLDHLAELIKAQEEIRAAAR
ncbi:hypothetical protein [Micrococcus luteus]|uniref:hypothetical protein n=1 Tax=Micrococcus luteus TaxID=1270 RepID=UPI003327E817